MAFFHFLSRFLTYFIVPSFIYAVAIGSTRIGDMIGAAAYLLIGVVAFFFALANTETQEVYISECDRVDAQGGGETLKANNSKGGYRWKAPTK